MQVERELLDLAFRFHGHKCPALPLGLRAGLIAMRELGVERAKDRQLFALVETGKEHAMACFADGVQVATGCTYGKYNIAKLYYGKIALILIDRRTWRAVRVALRPEFQRGALNSPFVRMRREGVPASEVPAEVVEPLIERVLSLPEGEVFKVGPVFEMKLEERPATFNVVECKRCGELVFERSACVCDGEIVCVSCAEGGAQRALVARLLEDRG